MTRGQLISRASLILGAGADPIHGITENNLLADLANEGVVNILSRTRLNVRCVDIDLLSETREYLLGSQILKLWNLKSGNREMLEVSSGDVGRVGSGHYAIPGYNRLVLAWDPATGDTLNAWYTPRPAPMTDAAHDPALEAYGSIPAEFHSAIINYMCWWGADIFGDAGSARGEKYRIAYEGKDGTGELGSSLGNIKLATNLRASTGSSTRRVGRERLGVDPDGIPSGQDVESLRG